MKGHTHLTPGEANYGETESGIRQQPSPFPPHRYLHCWVIFSSDMSKEVKALFRLGKHCIMGPNQRTFLCCFEMRSCSVAQAGLILQYFCTIIPEC